MGADNQYRRRFLTSLAAGTAVVAGCSSTEEQEDPQQASPSDTDEQSANETDPNETADTDDQPNNDEPEEDSQEDEEPDEEEQDDDQEGEEIGPKYFFVDQTGTLGQVGTDQAPEQADDWQVVRNELEEDDWEEKRLNDAEYIAGFQGNNVPGISMSPREIVEKAHEISQNPTDHLSGHLYDDLDLEEEDEEILYIRGLIQKGQDAGILSSGFADDVVNGLAEWGIEELDLDFDLTLSTLPATEPHTAGDIENGGARRTGDYGAQYENSGFRHYPGFLQYEKDGKQEAMYVELTDALSPSLFRTTVRDPQESVYRSDLENDTISLGREAEPGDSGRRWPEHYVTALDYTKARELEKRDILGLDMNAWDTQLAVGDRIEEALIHMVEDVGITGSGSNPDWNLTEARPEYGGTLVSDEFGESIEDYVTDPTTEENDYVENVGRALYKIRSNEGWGKSLAVTGTIENPEIWETDLSTLNEVRRNGEYDTVRERVTA